MTQDIALRLAGHLTIQHMRAGLVIDVDAAGQTITTVGKAWLVDKLQDLPLAAAQVKFHQTGTSGTAASAGDVALGSPLYSPVAGTRGETTPTVYRSVATIQYTGAHTIAEWGIYTTSSSGVLFARKTLSRAVLAGDTVQFTWNLTTEPAVVGTCTTTIDGDYATVAAAVAAANPGDVICVNAGSWTWSSTLVINSQITLQGAGIGQTILTQGDPTKPLITWTTVDTGLTRLTGFTMLGSPSSPAGGGYHQLIFQGVSSTVRVDHNRFVIQAPAGLSALLVQGYVRGVADHNTFDLSALNFCCGYYVHHHTWSTPGTNFGDVSWAAADTWGTAEAWYWEANTIVYDNTGHASGKRHAATSDGWQGSRVVNRFNTYTNVLLSGGHGTDSGQRWRGRRQTESYHETLAFDCTTCGGTDGGISPAIGGRGGPMMVFDNAITDGNGSTVATALGMSVDRARRVDTSYQPWTYCGETSITSLTVAGVMTTAVAHGIGVATYSGAPTKVRITGATGADAALYNGVHDVLAIGSPTQATIYLSAAPSAPATGTLVLTSPFDGNTVAAGYPCLDQVGYGQSDLLAGTNPSPVGWPNQVLTPSLYWHNTLNGVAQAPVPSLPGLLLDREYHTDSFIGRGVVASRPGTCATGDLYWATDQGIWNATVPAGTSGKLYRCTAPNTWTAWYGHNNATGEPYAYPHPLTLV